MTNLTAINTKINKATMVRMWSPYGMLAGDELEAHEGNGEVFKMGHNDIILRMMDLEAAHKFLSYLEIRMIVDPDEFTIEMPMNFEAHDRVPVSGSKALDVLDEWFGRIEL